MNSKGFTLIEVLISLTIVVSVGTIITKTTNSSLGILESLKTNASNSTLVSFLPISNHNKVTSKTVHFDKLSFFKDDEARRYLKNIKGTYSSKRVKSGNFSDKTNKPNIDNSINTNQYALKKIVTKHIYFNEKNKKYTHIYTISFNL
jgi:prepilin-type N-terminal cleavage/methylation domain-containing protein